MNHRNKKNFIALCVFNFAALLHGCGGEYKINEDSKGS